MTPTPGFEPGNPCGNWLSRLTLLGQNWPKISAMPGYATSAVVAELWKLVLYLKLTGTKRIFLFGHIL